MTHRNHFHLGICVAVILSFTGCSKEPPAPSVDDFLEDKLLLDSTLVRCTQNRAEMRYEPECVNVREAVNLIAVREEKASREELEAQSKRKREALRRTQWAVAEARRRAAERQRLVEQGGVVVEFDEVAVNDAEDGDAVVIDATGGEATPLAPENDAAGAPAADVDETLANDAASDIEAVREELKRRDEEGLD